MAQKFKKTQTIENLLAIHAYMTAYRKENGINPSDSELVKIGLVSSTSVASKCLDRMAELNLIQRIRRVARGSTPLPISQAAKEVQAAYARLQSEI